MDQIDIFTGEAERESYIVSDVVKAMFGDTEVILRCRTTPLTGPVANDELPPWL